MYSSNPKVKFKSAKILTLVSRNDPKKLYPKIDFFIDLMDSENSILKWNAIDVIANLALWMSTRDLKRYLTSSIGLFKRAV